MTVPAPSSVKLPAGGIHREATVPMGVPGSSRPVRGDGRGECEGLAGDRGGDGIHHVDRAAGRKGTDWKAPTSMAGALAATWKPRSSTPGAPAATPLAIAGLPVSKASVSRTRQAPCADRRAAVVLERAEEGIERAGAGAGLVGAWVKVPSPLLVLPTRLPPWLVKWVPFGGDVVRARVRRLVPGR